MTDRRRKARVDELVKLGLTRLQAERRAAAEAGENISDLAERRGDSRPPHPSS
jgi:hypothetical protein